MLNWTLEIEIVKESHVCIWIEFMVFSFNWALGHWLLGVEWVSGLKNSVLCI